MVTFGPDILRKSTYDEFNLDRTPTKIADPSGSKIIVLSKKAKNQI